MTHTTIAGNLTTDPELRYTANGTPVANFTIAHTPRRFDKDAGEWKDADTVYLRSTVWGKQAQTVAESLTKGARVVAAGSLTQSSYQDKDGNKRTSIELEVEEIGTSLRYTATTPAPSRTADPVAV